MNAVKLWCHAARPKTLFIGISPIAIGTVIAITEGFFDWLVFGWTLFGTLMIQIGTNYSNDYFDFLKGADTSSRKGPHKVLEKGLVTPRAMLNAFTLCFICAAVSTYMLFQRGGPLLIIVGILCVAFSILYTAPPFPLAYLGLGDLFVLIFYGPIATLFCYYLQTLHFSIPVALASLAPGLLGVLVLTLNNLRDHEEDARVNKKTLVVRLGQLYGKRQCLVVFILSFLVPLSITMVTRSHPYLPLTSIALLLTGSSTLKKVVKASTAEEYKELFVHAARLVPLYTLVFCITWPL